MCAGPTVLRTEEGYFLTAEQAETILNEILRLTERDREGLYDEDDE